MGATKESRLLAAADALINAALMFDADGLPLASDDEGGDQGGGEAAFGTLLFPRGVSHVPFFFLSLSG